MDVQAHLSQLTSESREALADKIKARLARANDVATDHDVSIIGGGIAALTLALELRSARPGTRVLIIEPTPHPVPEITHTVGESTVEVSAHYLRDRLGMADHLRTSQIRKMGLRMFFRGATPTSPDGSNSAARRSPRRPPIRSTGAGWRTNYISAALQRAST